MPSRYTAPPAPKPSYRENLLNGGAVIRETMPRWGTLMATLTANATGVECLNAVDLYAGDVLSAICFVNKTQPVAGTGTPAGYFALRDGSGALLCYTADTSGDWAAWTAATELNKAITKDAAAGTISAYTVPTDGVYYLCCMAYLGASGGTALALGGNTYLITRHANGYISAPTQKKFAATGTTTGLTTAVPPATQALSFGLAGYAYGFIH